MVQRENTKLNVFFCPKSQYIKPGTRFPYLKTLGVRFTKFSIYIYIYPKQYSHCTRKKESNNLLLLNGHNQHPLRKEKIQIIVLVLPSK